MTLTALTQSSKSFDLLMNEEKLQDITLAQRLHIIGLLQIEEEEVERRSLYPKK